MKTDYRLLIFLKMRLVSKIVRSKLSVNKKTECTKWNFQLRRISPAGQEKTELHDMIASWLKPF